MRLQRGEVYLYLSPKVMQERRIKDMDMVRVYNHMGEWFARAKEWPGLPPDVVFTEHGWDHQYTKNWTHYNNLNCEFLNPLEMAGGTQGTHRLHREPHQQPHLLRDGRGHRKVEG